MALTVEKQLIDAIDKSTHALITFRRDWTVDAVASALALRGFIEKRGKRVDVAAENFDAPKSLNFLAGLAQVQPGLSQLQKFIVSLDLTRAGIDELSYDRDGDKLRIFITPKTGQFEPKDVTTAAAEFKYDLIITVGTPDYPSLGGLFAANTDFFYRQPTVNIDHEPSNEQFGNLNCVDITAASTSEVVFNLLKASGQPFLDEDIATCLLAGMIAETKSFKSPRVTPKALAVASELIAAGARREEVIQHLYRTRSLSTLKLWGRALARLKYDPAAKFAWTLLVRQDFIHAGAKEETLADVIEELIVNAPEAEIISVMYEQEDASEPNQVSGICALVSSEKHSDATALVASLKPQGTRRLARVCFPGTDMLTAEKSVINAIYKSLGKKGALPDLPIFSTAVLTGDQPLAAPARPAKIAAAPEKPAAAQTPVTPTPAAAPVVTLATPASDIPAAPVTTPIASPAPQPTVAYAYGASEETISRMAELLESALGGVPALAPVPVETAEQTPETPAESAPPSGS